MSSQMAGLGPLAGGYMGDGGLTRGPKDLSDPRGRKAAGQAAVQQDEKGGKGGAQEGPLPQPHPLEIGPGGRPGGGGPQPPGRADDVASCTACGGGTLGEWAGGLCLSARHQPLPLAQGP